MEARESKEFRLKVRVPDVSESGWLSISIPNDEWNRFPAYLEAVDGLKETQFFRGGMEAKMKMHWDGDNGARFDVNIPDWDDIPGFLHRLRPLILEKEYPSFNRVRGVLARRIRDPDLRSFLGSLHELWLGKQFQAQVVISINEIVVNSERTLQDWLNSHEYHRDTDKRERIAQLERFLPEPFIRGIFVNLLSDKVRAIFVLARIIKELIRLEPQGTVTITLEKPR